MALWDKISSRGNVDDRRGLRAAPLGGLGIGGVALLLAITYFNGGNVVDVLPTILGELQSSQVSQPIDTAAFEGVDEYEVFTSTVLGSTNDVWTRIFRDQGRTYIPPKLVLFREATQSSCGGVSSDVGPHYCSRDETIYLDETFFDELTSRFGAQGGDVAQAYVLAHEVGHNVQHQLGRSDQVARDGSNEASVRLELQADCYAGVWAHSLKGKGVFEPGEIQEALDAAAAVGDDRIQQRTEGRVSPETWTHGSSAERVRWFTVGYEYGSAERCNTFS